MYKKRNINHIYLSLFFILLYIPILSVILYSFNESPSTAKWTGFSFKWYQMLMEDKVLKESLWLSLQVGLWTAVLSSILGTFSAIVSQMISQSMEKMIDSLMILPLLVPEVALGISLMILYTFIGLPLGQLTLVLSHSLFCLPYVYIMVQLRLKEIDFSIIEASYDLGASTWQMIKSIILPLIFPAIFTSSLLALAMSLDDVVISTYVSGHKGTLPVHVFSMMRVGVTPKINALCTVVLCLTFLILGISQTEFKKGDQDETV